MSNIDDDAPELELDDLNMASDGMPDPTATDAAAPAAEPVSLDDAKPVDDSRENVEAEEDKKKPAAKTDGMMSNLTKASPYTVMLAISVLAIGVALLCLIFEWNTYGFQRKPPKNITMNSVQNTRFLAANGPSSQRNSLDQAERRIS